MSIKRLSLGKSGEKLAVRFLSRKGWRIAETNFRTRRGEIDIIAYDKKTLVFVEVKTRKTGFIDSPLNAVTHGKQRQISMVAQEYLAANDLFDSEARFDVIGVNFREEGKTQIEHIENAFDLSYGW